MADIRVTIGIDVGGTNTDAAVVDKARGKARVLAEAKTLTTADIISGVKEAIRFALLKLADRFTELAIQQVNIGTTHFINAIVEGKGLTKVSVIRLCGTASKRLPPFCDFSSKLADKIKGSVFLTNGGYQLDGQDITKLDKTEITSVLETLKKNGERHIVISGIFSPVRPDQEDEVVELIREYYPDASVTASKSIGRLGLLERENAAILNECLKPLCSEALLSGLQDAFVVDIGGTSTDAGLLCKGFPRHASSEVKIGGIRSNLRMPDVVSIALGGGSYVRPMGNKIRIGPNSAGYNIVQEAFVFANGVNDMKGRSVTATDIAVAAGIAHIGNIENVKTIRGEVVKQGVSVLHEMVAECVDHMRFNDRDLPLVLVGGGSILIDVKHKFSGVSSVIKPEHFDVANAVGAALCQVSASVDDTLNLEKFINKAELNETNKQEQSSVLDRSGESDASVSERTRQDFLTKARDKAVAESINLAEKKALEVGGGKDSIKLLYKEDISVSYKPGHTRIKVKVAAELQTDDTDACKLNLDSPKNQRTVKTEMKGKQTITATGQLLEETGDGLKQNQSPCLDPKTGEWLLDEYDIECISIGSGILGSGGGGSPHLGKVAALKALRDGKQLRVITPSKFFKSADKENDLTVIVALMGAPMVLNEKLMTGNETKGALEAIKDLYNIGKYKDGQLTEKSGVNIKQEDGLSYIDDYKTTNANTVGETGVKKVAALMSVEIGGMNSIEPLLLGAEIGLPVLDCDGMGRAFPKLQMFAPFMYECVSYPSAIADDKGRRSVVLYSENAKRLEDCFRKAVISMGCIGGVVLSHLTPDQIMKYTVQHSLSYARRTGNTILDARKHKTSPVDQMIECTNGILLINGKVSDVKRETTGGFTKGVIKVDGLDTFTGHCISIDFQNEFLVARELKDNKVGEVIACVPDLITVLDIDTAQPLTADEVPFGMRVSVVAMPSAPLMATEKALEYVGPQAFGYPSDVMYKPVSVHPEHRPVGPQ